LRVRFNFHLASPLQFCVVEIFFNRKATERMAIITLTSDMGLTDHYVASVKAAILANAPQAVIVDVSHNIRSFDIHEAAFHLRSVWHHFPMGTVHVIGINPEYSMEQTHLIVQYMSHYFIAADNGVFSLIFDDQPEDVYEISLEQGNDWTFPMKGVFASVAAHLSKGGTVDFVAKKISRYKTVLSPKPIIEEKAILGHVEYIDKYGNVYCNITKDIFEAERKGRNFSILFKRRNFSILFKRALYTIRNISNNFSDVPEGERLAMWASNGHLFIALNGGATDQGGGAASLLSLKKGEIIRIEFDGNAHSEDEF